MNFSEKGQKLKLDRQHVQYTRHTTHTHTQTLMECVCKLSESRGNPFEEASNAYLFTLVLFFSHNKHLKTPHTCIHRKCAVSCNCSCTTCTNYNCVCSFVYVMMPIQKVCKIQSTARQSLFTLMPVVMMYLLLYYYICIICDFNLFAASHANI